MSILIVSGMEGVRNCADVVSKQLNMSVDFAEGRRGALDAMRKREFLVVVVDETLVEKRRGLGMYVTDGARDKLLATERDRFLSEDWPLVLERILSLGLTADDLLTPAKAGSP